MRGYLVDGYWYLGFTHEGRIYLITRVGRQGDCVRF